MGTGFQELETLEHRFECRYLNKNCPQLRRCVGRSLDVEFAGADNLIGNLNDGDDARNHGNRLYDGHFQGRHIGRLETTGEANMMLEARQSLGGKTVMP